MAARQSAPVLGALCSRSAHAAGRSAGGIPSPPRRQPWEFMFGYRFQPSSRHFVGSEEQKHRELLGNQIQNTYHLIDLSISRQVSRRWAVNASLPILYAYRNQLYSPRGEFRVASIGDVTIGPRVWLFQPPTESGGNIGVGVSLKLPTGEYNATGEATDAAGNRIVATADQSIQAGDGGTGFAVDIQAYRPWIARTNVYFSGVYLFNPRNINGVYTFRRRPGEEYMSVADQYLARGGLSRPLPHFSRIVVTFGGRIEGVPSRDRIGGSDGFRRPGYAVSLDPGFMVAHRAYIFSVNVPFAVYRNRTRSVTDIRNGTHGDAAFADYALIIGVSRRF